jgi:hypothetical protein
VKLDTHLKLVSRSRKCGSIHLHGVVLNWLSTGTNLSFTFGRSALNLVAIPIELSQITRTVAYLTLISLVREAGYRIIEECLYVGKAEGEMS